MHEKHKTWSTGTVTVQNKTKNNINVKVNVLTVYKNMQKLYTNQCKLFSSTVTILWDQLLFMIVTSYPSHLKDYLLMWDYV